MGKNLSLEEIKNINPKILLTLISRAKKYLKTDETINSIFKKYNLDINELDLIPICFADLPVSARTDHGIIYLNYKLLMDGDFLKDYSYLIHEVTHYAQQTTGDKPTKGSEGEDYLNNPYEREGFQNQVKFISEEDGDKEAKKYVNKVLDHHEINEKNERKELKDVLLKKI